MSEYGSPTFRKVCDIEEPLTVASDIVKGIALIAETLGSGSDQAGVLQRLAWLANDHLEQAELMRGELWDMAHPDQEARPTCG